MGETDCTSTVAFMNVDTAVIRILDASLNRASEGLRVVEDYVRFALDDAHLTEQFKRLRHDLAAAGAALPWSERHAARDTQRDVGTAIATASESSRSDAWGVCQASLERVKQSLRSLEEYGKVVGAPVGQDFESMRYRLYTLEAALGRTVDAIDRVGELRLYALIDGCESESAFARLVKELIEGGVDVIQLRDKRLCDRELIARARWLVDEGRLALNKLGNSPDLARSGLLGDAACGPLVVINDRADVAAAVDADGVHLGQDDMSVKEARAIVGPRKLIGVSTHSIEQARAAVLDGASYIGVGPTFPSKTKEFENYPGLELLKQVAREIRLPSFAIGGISPDNVEQVIAAGFTHVAVSSAVKGGRDPAAAVQQLRLALKGP
jgi:thiamine-phosphate pyrophosphorylase